MKVLFLGEFSGVFNELIPALREQKVETYLISDGDCFKGYKADFNVKYCKRKNSFPFGIFNRFIAVVGLSGIKDFVVMWPKLKKKLIGYEIVQLNNDYPFFYFGWAIILYVIHYIVRHNNAKIFLSAYGDDYVINCYECRNYIGQFRNQSVLQKKAYLVKQFFKRAVISRYVLEHVTAICPGTYHYKQAYANNIKTCGKIFPFAIGRDKIGVPLQITSEEPIVIFHGWQTGREATKGNDVFDRVIRKVVNKYGSSKIKYIIVKNIPFEEYCTLFLSAHIFIDQLYAVDKGMNGLLGMAAGKVVFSGFMPEALAEYRYYEDNIIGIRAYNDETYLFDKFCELIENPSLMEEISKNAIDFVLHNHLSTVVAQQYIDLWSS